MINLPHETEALAKRLAEAQKLSVEDAIRRALEQQASPPELSRTRSRQFADA
jgi:hypothetical protein